MPVRYITLMRPRWRLRSTAAGAAGGGRRHASASAGTWRQSPPPVLHRLSPPTPSLMHVDPRGTSSIPSLNARRPLRPCVKEKKRAPTIKPPTTNTTSSLTPPVGATPSPLIVLAHHHTARQAIRSKAWAGGRVGARPCQLPTPPTPTTEPHSSRPPTAALPCSCTASDAWRAGAGR